VTGPAIGVDAGGSHTEVAVAGEDGKVLARAEGAGAAMRPGAGAASAAVIAEVARRAAAEAGVTLPVERAVVGAAGAGRAPESTDLAAALQTAGVARQAQVMGDGQLALLAAFDDRPGILINAGTGSIGYARDPGGRLHRAGGYGWQMGDEGGGYWLGRRALAAAGRVHDGRDKPSRLPQRLMRAVGVAAFDDLVRWAMLASPAEVASLAQPLLDAANEGESLARAVVRDAAAELVDLAVALSRHFSSAREVAVVTMGGLLRPGSALAAALRVELRSRLPQARLATDRIDPAGTAAQHAARPG
jgi:N-acetylglucosamine kinase-like BadF-type ATPase